MAADAIEILNHELENKQKELTHVEGKLKDLGLNIQRLEKVRQEIQHLKTDLSKLEGTERSYLSDEENFKKYTTDRARMVTEIHTMSSRLETLVRKVEKAKEGKK